jgi:hypothetical protein
MIVVLASLLFWIATRAGSKNTENSMHSNSFYWPDKTETDRHIERISYQTNANYVNNLIQQVKGDKHGKQ